MQSSERVAITSSAVRLLWARAAIGIAVLAVAMASTGCGSSATSGVSGNGVNNVPSSPSPQPTSTITITASQGFKYGLTAGQIQIVPQTTAYGQPLAAPPGEGYLVIPITVFNLQQDRIASLEPFASAFEVSVMASSADSFGTTDCSKFAVGTTTDVECLIAGGTLAGGGFSSGNTANDTIPAGGSVALKFTVGPVRSNAQLSSVRLRYVSYDTIGGDNPTTIIPLPGQ